MKQQLKATSPSLVALGLFAVALSQTPSLHAAPDIHDRSTLFSGAFQSILRSTGVEPVRLPPRSPNLNAYAERFVRTIKEGCLNQIIPFGEQSLRRTLSEFVEHYHKERNHQGIDNKILQPDFDLGRMQGDIACRQRLGGMLNYYYREAA